MDTILHSQAPCNDTVIGLLAVQFVGRLITSGCNHAKNARMFKRFAVRDTSYCRTRIASSDCRLVAHFWSLVALLVGSKAFLLLKLVKLACFHESMTGLCRSEHAVELKCCVKARSHSLDKEKRSREEHWICYIQSVRSDSFRTSDISQWFLTDQDPALMYITSSESIKENQDSPFHTRGRNETSRPSRLRSVLDSQHGYLHVLQCFPDKTMVSIPCSA